MSVSTALLDDLAARGLIQDTTDRVALAERLAAGPVTLYHGIDPSAPSLHIGNFVGVLMLRRFQDAGHHPLVLVGGATGMIGDPGGRSEERNLLDEDALVSNVAGIRAQLERFVDLDRAELVNNYDWTRGVGVLEFLRDVGKHVTVNQMVAKESVRTRMASEHGISYTEFSYMLLQAYDFWWLHANRGCELQIGGSDQWGNITAGVDLVRRRSSASVHALTWPLITRADGQKFGKSVSGAVWLDPERTLPYEFHQYWMNADDRDLERFLLQLTLLDPDEVDAIVEAHRVAPERREGQRRLADEITALVHGNTEVRRAALAGEALFGTGAIDGSMLEALEGVIPRTEIDPAVLGGADAVVEVLVATGLTASKSEARRLVGQGGVSVNRSRVDHDTDLSARIVGERWMLVQKGKKARHLVVVRTP